MVDNLSVRRRGGGGGGGGAASRVLALLGDVGSLLLDQTRDESLLNQRLDTLDMPVVLFGAVEAAQRCQVPRNGRDSVAVVDLAVGRSAANHAAACDVVEGRKVLATERLVQHDVRLQDSRESCSNVGIEEKK